MQIRSKRMDDIAEKGIAAHWVYKRSGYDGENENETDKWLSRVKEILVNPDVNALELLDIIHNDLTSGEITVFTPKGEQKTTQKGATALDFAYLIHTEIGNKAIAAKVNMKLVPLSQQLQTGDQVEIITAEAEHPKREWLQYLTTRRARNIVLDYFRNERDQTVEFGRKMVTEQLESLGYRLDDTTKRQMMDAYQTNSLDDLYFRIGLGVVKLNNLSEILKKSSNELFYRKWLRNLFRRDDKTPLKKGEYVTATCCNPIPGDPVIGFRSSDGTITVHKKTCKVAEAMASKHGDLVVAPHWEMNNGEESFLVRISLRGIDRMGMLNEISRYISLVMGVNMRKLYLSSEEGIFEGYIDLYVAGKDILDKMMRKLSLIDGMQSVVRTDI